MMPNSPRRSPFTVALATVMIALVLVMPSVLAGNGGGDVSNKAPYKIRFDASNQEVYAGESVVLSGLIKDDNGETDMVALKLEVLGNASMTTIRNVTAADLNTSTEPAEFGTDGWKIWNKDGAKKGKLEFAYTYTFPAGTVDTFVWRLSMKDEASFAYDSQDDVTVEVRDGRLGVPDHPVNGNGTQQVGGAWGDWNALPNATAVSADNYIRIENRGFNTGQAFVVDFTQAVFAGAEDGDFEIPIDGNLNFAWAEVALNQTPADGAFTTMAASATGSEELTFSAKDRAIFVKYELAQLPDILADQAYEAAYTVTPVN